MLLCDSVNALACLSQIQLKLIALRCIGGSATLIQPSEGRVRLPGLLISYTVIV